MVYLSVCFVPAFCRQGVISDIFSGIRIRYLFRPGKRGRMSEIRINEKNKDRLFTFLFGNEEYKENTLSLYNAVNDSNYSNIDDVQIYTIGDAVYIGRKNDVAVLFDSRLSLWEHQSTYNPNMPLRGLIYFGQMFDRYVTTNEISIYGSSLVRLPTPKYCVFYNGDDNLPPVIKLKLSEAFAEPDESGEFEWTATMYNLNHENNSNLLKNCKTLSDYMTFVNTVKANKKQGLDKYAAVDKAVTECIKNDILKEVLLKHRSEVVGMVLTEFNEEVYKKGIYDEGYSKGKDDGKAEGIVEGFSQGQSSLAEAVKKLCSGATVEDLIKEGVDKKTAELAWNCMRK